MNKIGIKDIAKKAGVSIGTVDRVLHDRGQVAEETKRKVLQTAKELKYRPNMLARSLASRKDLVIGILIPKADGPNHYWHAPLKGIKRAMRELYDHGVKLEECLYDLSDQSDFEAKARMMLEHNELNGFLASPIYFESLDRLLEETGRNDLPFVLIDSKPDINIDKEYVFIGQNSFQSGRVAAELMARTVPPESTLGVLEIETSEVRFPTMKQRAKGFTRYIKENNLPYRVQDIFINQNDLLGFRDSCIENILGMGGLFITNSRAWQPIKILTQVNQKLPFIIGYDLLEPNVKYLMEKKIQYLIGQRPRLQGFYGLHQIVALLINNRLPTENITIPIDIITKENYRSYQAFQLKPIFS